MARAFLREFNMDDAGLDERRAAVAAFRGPDFAAEV